MSQIMQPRIRHDSGRIPRLDPETPEVILVQRFIVAPAGKHPLPGRGSGEAVQQLPCRLAEQNVPRSRLRVNQGQSVGLDFTPPQAAYLARPASGQQEQAHRRDADRIFVLAHAQDRTEPRKVVRAEQPPARWSPVADDARARVPAGFGPMASRDGAVEHVAQYVMTAVRAARLSASVLVEEVGDIGADDGPDAEMAERGQDGAVEIAQGRLHRGRLPRGRAPLHILGGELRQRRAGSGKGGRREPDRAGTSLGIGQHRAIAVHVLPLEPQRLGLARAGVEQEAQRGDGDPMIRFRVVERPTERGKLVVRKVVRLEARLAPPQSLARVGSSRRSPSASACFIIGDSTASDRFADPARVAERSSNQLRTSFAPMASTRRSPKAGSMYRFMSPACARRVASFQRSAQSARKAGPNVRTVGTAAGAPPASASAISARAACRASSTVSASCAPSVRLTTEPLQRRCTIYVLRPFGRARSPSPGAALSHSTASRPPEGAKARASAIVIFVLFAMFRSLPFVSVVTGAARVSPCWGTPRTRRVTEPSSEFGRSEVPRSNAARAASRCYGRAYSASQMRGRVAIFYAIRRLVLTPDAPKVPYNRACVYHAVPGANYDRRAALMAWPPAERETYS